MMQNTATPTVAFKTLYEFIKKGSRARTDFAKLDAALDVLSKREVARILELLARRKAEGEAIEAKVRELLPRMLPRLLERKARREAI